ncbi:hypothetical protein EVG20_g1756 [Dentipellis fragilis]|uniref:Secreted protein n=1 Tax=Dentipellis fragilis TaxID=205917 RepID=A0A4Y9Z904_9AGAM|nr:hypothetical protein EVG20_g1756 [Dentipellis fragilis]
MHEPRPSRNSYLIIRLIVLPIYCAHVGSGSTAQQLRAQPVSSELSPRPYILSLCPSIPPRLISKLCRKPEPLAVNSHAHEPATRIANDSSTGI